MTSTSSSNKRVVKAAAKDLASFAGPSHLDKGLLVSSLAAQSRKEYSKMLKCRKICNGYSEQFFEGRYSLCRALIEEINKGAFDVKPSNRTVLNV